LKWFYIIALSAAAKNFFQSEDAKHAKLQMLRKPQNIWKPPHCKINLTSTGIFYVTPCFIGIQPHEEVKNFLTNEFW